jgi:tetratricopeptide (TPR) repeat protein
MKWANLIVVLIALLARPASGETLRAALERSTALQGSGQAPEALQCLQEARVENPESTALIFAIAGAQVAVGDSLLATHDLDEAARHFRLARETFERCASDTRLSESVAYNAATCLLRLDGALERKDDYGARVENLRGAVAALEGVVVSYPAHARAKKNLDCARYRLALLLQSPPGDPEGKDEKSEEPDKPATEVAGASTQIPDATAVVEEGAIVVLHMKPRGEAAP